MSIHGMRESGCDTYVSASVPLYRVNLHVACAVLRVLNHHTALFRWNQYSRVNAVVARWQIVVAPWK